MSRRTRIRVLSVVDNLTVISREPKLLTSGEADLLSFRVFSATYSRSQWKIDYEPEGSSLD